MANWTIRCSQDYLFPVIARLREELLKRDVLHCDETPVQVLKEEGKKPQSKSYMWLYRTGKDGKAPVVLYDYQPSRNGDNAVKFLADFKGYVHADGYSGYNKLTGITRCGCWAHLRRKFVEAVPEKKGKNTPPTNAQLGRDYCSRLFKMVESFFSKMTKQMPLGIRVKSKDELKERIYRYFNEENEDPVVDATWG